MNEQDKANLLVKEQAATELAEEALEIAIKNAALTSEIIKALRLTCKRTKVAADAKVKRFTLSLAQGPWDLQRSGLLNNISKLCIAFDLMYSGDDDAPHLLNLAVAVCGKSLKALYITMSAYPATLRSCASIISKCNWESVEELSIRPFTSSTPGLLSAVLERPCSFPSLKQLWCNNYKDPSAGDIEALVNSGCADKLTKICIEWSEEAYESNRAPAMIVAMRNLLEKATNVESLELASSTYECFNSEKLVLPNLKSIKLSASDLPAQGSTVNFSPALARPWPMLESLHIADATFTEADLVRIFEAEETLHGLKKLHIQLSGTFIGEYNALSCVRRPHLEEFNLLECSTAHVLISKLARIMKEDGYALPSLKKLFVNYTDYSGLEHAPTLGIEALSEFLSCPFAAALEHLAIGEADLFVEGIGLLYDIVNYCPKLTYLYLDENNLGRPAVALLLGFGMMGAWPQLEKLSGILDHGNNHAGSNRINSEHLYLSRIDVQETLRRAWPGLVCY